MESQMTRMPGAEHIEKVGQEIKEGSKSLSDVLSKFVSHVDDFCVSSNKFASFQKKQQIFISVLTAALVVVGGLQAFITYRQSEIMKKQSEIAEQQTEIMKKSNFRIFEEHNR